MCRKTKSAIHRRDRCFVEGWRTVVKTKSHYDSPLGGITLNQTGRELECMLLLMGIYLGISLIISSVMNIYNNRVKLKER